jgi:hypothetical protein
MVGLFLAHYFSLILVLHLQDRGSKAYLRASLRQNVGDTYDLFRLAIFERISEVCFRATSVRVRRCWIVAEI